MKFYMVNNTRYQLLFVKIWTTCKKWNSKLLKSVMIIDFFSLTLKCQISVHLQKMVMIGMP